jgi:hypothetical protein
MPLEPSVEANAVIISSDGEMADRAHASTARPSMSPENTAQTANRTEARA